MKFGKHFSSRSTKNQPLARTALGRRARMETLEARRVLTSYFIDGNHESIQDAIDDAANDGKEDTIFLMSDTYFQNIHIQDNDPLKIIGLGNVVLRPGNGSNGDTSTITAGSDDILSIYNSDHVTLKNLKFKYAVDDAIDVQDTYKISLYDIRAEDSNDDGLDAENVDYVKIYDSKFNYNDDNGIELINVGYAYLKDVQAKHNGDSNDDSEVDQVLEGSEESNDGNGIYYVNGGSSEPQEAIVSAFSNGSPDGHLEIYSGDYSKNYRDGIHTDGVKTVEIDTIYANDNGRDGVDVEDYSQDAEELTIHYAATDSNGDDGVESDADDVSITTFRALHNDGAGLDLDSGYEAYIHNADFSHNGGAGLDIDYVEEVDIDYIQANYNGTDTNNTGLDVDYVDELDIHNSQFIGNYGDGINVYMNEYGETDITWVDSSYNTGDGIHLRYGSSDLDGVNTSNNEQNGIYSYNLYDLDIHNTSSTYNDYNGLLIEGSSSNGQDPEGSNGNGHGSFYGTDVRIEWSEFVHNYEDGIHADHAGKIVLDRIRSSYNGDDGFDSINPEIPAHVIDSIFEHNYDEDFNEDFFYGT